MSVVTCFVIIRLFIQLTGYYFFIAVYEEEGVDAGGVTREWYSTLARSIFNPDYALFQPSSSDQLVYQPSPHSYVNVR